MQYKCHHHCMRSLRHVDPVLHCFSISPMSLLLLLLAPIGDVTITNVSASSHAAGVEKGQWVVARPTRLHTIRIVVMQPLPDRRHYRLSPVLSGILHQ